HRSGERKVAIFVSTLRPFSARTRSTSCAMPATPSREASGRSRSLSPGRLASRRSSRPSSNGFALSVVTKGRKRRSWLLRRQSAQDFKAPPQKISPERKSDHDFDELNDQFNSAHSYRRHTLPWPNRDVDPDVRASTCPVRNAGYLNCEG